MVDTHPWKSLIELVDVLATTGGSELALTGGDGLNQSESSISAIEMG